MLAKNNVCNNTMHTIYMRIHAKKLVDNTHYFL